MILYLAEAGAIDVQISPDVLREIEDALREKAPHMLGALALLLDRGRVHVVSAADAEQIDAAELLTGYRPDASVLAAAHSAQPSYFVTLDRKHFLDNPTIRASVTFPVGTPGDFLAWYRQQLAAPF
jgi:hypothetical protein